MPQALATLAPPSAGPYDPLPCQRCDRLTRRRWGRAVICRECLYEMFPHQVRRGRPLEQRADGLWDLVCTRCEATWAGEPWERCGWCEDAERAQQAAQRTLLLCEPESDDVLDMHDSEIQRVAYAWSTRLAVGVQARLLSATEADEAVRSWLQKVTTWRQS